MKICLWKFPFLILPGSPSELLNLKSHRVLGSLSLLRWWMVNGSAGNVLLTRLSGVYSFRCEASRGPAANLQPLSLQMLWFDCPCWLRALNRQSWDGDVSSAHLSPPDTIEVGSIYARPDCKPLSGNVITLLGDGSRLIVWLQENFLPWSQWSSKLGPSYFLASKWGTQSKLQGKSPAVSCSLWLQKTLLQVWQKTWQKKANSAFAGCGNNRNKFCSCLLKRKRAVRRRTAAEVHSSTVQPPG